MLLFFPSSNWQLFWGWWWRWGWCHWDLQLSSGIRPIWTCCSSKRSLFFCFVFLCLIFPWNKQHFSSLHHLQNQNTVWSVIYLFEFWTPELRGDTWPAACWMPCQSLSCPGSLYSRLIVSCNTDPVITAWSPTSSRYSVTHYYFINQFKCLFWLVFRLIEGFFLYLKI